MQRIKTFGKKFYASLDARAITLLMVVWAIFYWRLFTPTDVDAVSFVESDFSGQFVSWTSYSVERWHDGEIPLWNPYMNAGAPFLADPQTAVFYPPRLLTTALLSFDSDITHGDIYAALQIEMTFHVLLGTLLMYILLRRVTTEASNESTDNSFQLSVISSFIGAVIFGFSGFMNGYAPLQLPLLETFIWFPLVILGIHEATRPQNASMGWRCLALAGTGLALAVLAGHPQTVLFIGYSAVAYLIYRSWQKRFAWKTILLGIFVFGLVAGMLSAISWLPTLQFQSQSYREDFGFDDKGGGFAFQDLLQFLFPYLLGKWSPLYVSIVGVVLIAEIFIHRLKDHAFWIGLAILGLLVSFGKKLVIYDLVYLFLPGFSLFRGQERSAVLVVFSMSVLAALGAFYLLHFLESKVTDLPKSRLFQIRRVIMNIMLLASIFSFTFFILRLIPPNGELYENALNISIFTLFIGIMLRYLVSSHVILGLKEQWKYALVGLVIFELLSVNMGGENYENIPASQRMIEPAYIQTMRDHLDEEQRVEGLRGIGQSKGALYRLPDIWGDSPLRLENTEFYLWDIPIEQRWELLAVQIVNSEWQELPVPHEIVGTGEDSIGQFNIFKLQNPRPFALMMFQVTIESDDTQARQRTADLAFPLREIVILDQRPDGDLPNTPSAATVEIVEFHPETIQLDTQSETNGVLSIALPYDGNWQVEIDGQEATLLKAYGGLSAVYVPKGEHEVTLTYRPITVTIGAMMSASMFLILMGVTAWRFFQKPKSSIIQNNTEDHYHAA